MVRSRVSSSSLVSVGYDRDGQELEVEFVTGSIYRYFGVLPHVYEALMHAASKGRHFNEKIRGRYDFVRVAEQERPTAIESREVTLGSSRSTD